MGVHPPPPPRPPLSGDRTAERALATRRSVCLLRPHSGGLSFYGHIFTDPGATPLSGYATTTASLIATSHVCHILLYNISAPRYKSQKFKDWLMVGVSVEPKPNPLAIEVLCYMAYETVAQVIICGRLLMADSQKWRIEKVFFDKNFVASAGKHKNQCSHSKNQPVYSNFVQRMQSQYNLTKVTLLLMQFSFCR